MLVLVIDDDADVAAGIEALLADDGHRVLTAGEAQAGLDLLRTHPVDLVLLDLILPGGLSGYAACETFRSLRPDVPVVFVSGAFTSEADARLAERVGATGFLRKPFGRDELLAVVARALAEREQRPQAMLGFACEACGAEGRVRGPAGDATRVRCPNCGSVRVMRRAQLTPLGSSPLSPAPAALRRRILVADAAEHFRLYLLDLLTEAGHYVVTARGGPEAYALAREWTPDLVIAEWALPILNGLELSRRLRAHPRLRRIPLVLVTDPQPPEAPRPADAAGAELVLTKPIQADRFLDAIHDLIAQTPR